MLSPKLVYCNMRVSTYLLTNTKCLEYWDRQRVLVTCYVISNHWFPPSDRLPPFTKDIIDEFGHWLGATVSSAVCTVLKVLHHMTDELCEEIRYLQVVLCCRHFLEGAVVFKSQQLSFLLTYLTSVAQVLLVAHQEYWKVHWSVIVTSNKVTRQPGKPGGRGHNRYDDESYCMMSYNALNIGIFFLFKWNSPISVVPWKKKSNTYTFTQLFKLELLYITAYVVWHIYITVCSRILSYMNLWSSLLKHFLVSTQ